MDFEAANKEWDAYLDKQFQQNEQTSQAEVDEEDEVVQSFLTGVSDGTADDTADDTAASASRGTATSQAQPTEAERVARLERELAATQARAATLEQAQALQYAQLVQQSANSANSANSAMPYPVQPYSPFAEEELAIDDKLKETFGEAEPYVQAVARRVAQDLYNRTVQPLTQELMATRAALTDQQRFAQIQSKDVFLAQLRAVEPEIDTLAHSQEWQRWIQQPDEYGGTRTIAYHVQDGINSGNLKQVTGIIAKFRKEQQQQGRQQHQQVAPGRPAQTIPQTKMTSGRILRQSDFDRATVEFQQGRLSLDKYEKVMAAFNQAYLEGRVQ